MDLDFNLQYRNELTVDRLDGVSVSGNSQHVCIATIDSITGLITLQQLDASGHSRWSVPVSQHVMHWEFVSVLASGNDCYLSAPTMTAEGLLETKTRRIDGGGKLKDTITLTQVLSASLAVQNNAIFHAGLTEAGTPPNVRAVLTKHQRY